MFSFIVLLALAGGGFYIYRYRKGTKGAATPDLSSITKNPRALVQIAVAIAILLSGWRVLSLMTLLSGGAAEPGRIIGMMGVPVLIMVASLVGLGWLNRNSKLIPSRIQKPRRIVPGYVPPLSWMNYFDGLETYWNTRQKMKSSRWPDFTKSQDFLEERSNMPQFRLWYNTHDYIGGEARRANPLSREWVEVTDGNPSIGTDTSKMSMFIQIPVATNRPIPRERNKYYTELGLFEITTEQVIRLTTGPVREEKFELSRYGRTEVETWTLSAGVQGGRFRQAINVTGGGGTAKPVGLTTGPQGQATNLAPRPEDSDKL